MRYKIKRGIRMPRRERNSYPFREMEIGDSFLVPRSEVVNANRVRSAATHFWRRTSVAQFKVVTEKDGYRVFRIK